VARALAPAGAGPATRVRAGLARRLAARPWDALLDTFGTEELDALQRDLEQAAADIAERIRRRTAGSATPPPENQPTPSPAA
jgi:hypothetical protein